MRLDEDHYPVGRLRPLVVFDASSPKPRAISFLLVFPGMQIRKAFPHPHPNRRGVLDQSASACLLLCQMRLLCARAPKQVLSRVESEPGTVFLGSHCST
mmetsp:Transcript_66566/g.111319  ORF Transcript_66566/g.111319 Transcript_66566/m.111319 type:complete len:99 (-) Transcript_66566:1322-1618(-)